MARCTALSSQLITVLRHPLDVSSLRLISASRDWHCVSNFAPPSANPLTLFSLLSLPSSCSSVRLLKSGFISTSSLPCSFSSNDVFKGFSPWRRAASCTASSEKASRISAHAELLHRMLAEMVVCCALCSMSTCGAVCQHAVL